MENEGEDDIELEETENNDEDKEQVEPVTNTGDFVQIVEEPEKVDELFQGSIENSEPASPSVITSVEEPEFVDDEGTEAAAEKIYTDDEDGGGEQPLGEEKSAETEKRHSLGTEEMEDIEKSTEKTRSTLEHVSGLEETTETRKLSVRKTSDGEKTTTQTTGEEVTTEKLSEEAATETQAPEEENAVGKEQSDELRKSRKESSEKVIHKGDKKRGHRHHREAGRIVSGDFTPVSPAGFFKGTEEAIEESTYIPVRSEEEDEDSSTYEGEMEEIEYEEEMDRTPYYDAFDELVEKCLSIKMKNNFLHRKMAEYFKRRKMEHVLRETDQLVDTAAKYGSRLEALGELKVIDQMQRHALTTEINELRLLKTSKLKSVITDFTKMQSRERDVGKGLIFTKTGKEIPEKVLDRVLSRQKSVAKQVTDLRKANIKIRDRVSEKQAALKDLETIAEGLHLIDYEQMKVEHQSYADKIEERDEELNRLRNKCNNVTQVLAHLREKSAALTLKLIDLQEQLKGTDMEQIECRERLNYFKQERDGIRNAHSKLKDEVGLLTNTKLLMDMEDSVKESQKTEVELKRIQDQYEIQKYALRAIRKNIEDMPTKVQHKKKEAVKLKERKKSSVSTAKSKSNNAVSRALSRSMSRMFGTQSVDKFYKGRPSLVLPNPLSPSISQIFLKK